MSDKTPYEQYKEVARALYALPDDQLDTPEAEAIRDRLDPLWAKLTKEERDRFSVEYVELT